MTAEDNGLTTPQGFAPPTDAGDIVRPRRESSWPTVIGILAIIFGSLAAVGGLCGLFGPLFAGKMASMVPEEASAGLEEAQVWSAWNVISQILAMGLGVLCLTTGIGLVQRRLWAIGTAKVWAGLKILFAIITTIVAYMSLPQILDEISQQTAQDPNAPALPQGVLEGATTIGLFAFLLWACALPVFMLIWFSRGKIKNEITEWS